MSWSEARNEYPKALCSWVERCETNATIGGSMIGSDTCEEYYSRTMGPMFDYFEGQMEAGFLEYDEHGAKECLDSLKSTCQQTGDPCRHVFRGKLSVGSSCKMDEECSSGWCDTGNSCPGVCAEPAKEGEACGDTPCAEGLACLEGTCKPEPPPAELGEDCSNVSCAYGLYCDDQLVCQQRLPRDAACEKDDQCDPGLLCIQGTCQQPVLVTQEGEPCDADEGRFCDMDAGLWCSMGRAGTCEKFRQEGEKCLDLQNRTFVACDFTKDLYCDADLRNPTSDGYCRPLKDDGQGCTRDEECKSHTCESGSCQPYDPC